MNLYMVIRYVLVLFKSVDNMHLTGLWGLEYFIFRVCMLELGRLQ